jgi:hypothetical protein
MIKLLKYLLPLCILLLSGYLYCHEGTIHTPIRISSVKNSNYFIGENSQNSIIEPALTTEKRETKQNPITDIEEKENEVISFKKDLSFNTNIAALFYTQIAEYFFQYTQIQLFFFKHFSYYPSSKSLYLIFEVMRI